MPELPEVETIARDLAPNVTGRRILRVTYDREPPVFDSASLAPKLLIGRTIRGVGRAGKFVLFDLGCDLKLAVHLRMTGSLLVRRDSAPVPRTRAVLALSGGRSVVFADVRKFGRMRIFRGDPYRALKLGIEPFAKELDERSLSDLLRGRKTKIKTWLLDQRRIAGVGNIYACESLYLAGIRPTARVGNLSAQQRTALLISMRRVLQKAIRHRGSSVDDYVDAEGKEGEFQKQLGVYGRAGMSCRRCGTPIRRIVLAQRGTFYCPVCQR